MLHCVNALTSFMIFSDNKYHFLIIDGYRSKGTSWFISTNIHPTRIFFMCFSSENIRAICIHKSDLHTFLLNKDLVLHKKESVYKLKRVLQLHDNHCG